MIARLQPGDPWKDQSQLHCLWLPGPLTDWPMLRCGRLAEAVSKGDTCGAFWHAVLPTSIANWNWHCGALAFVWTGRVEQGFPMSKKKSFIDSSGIEWLTLFIWTSILRPLLSNATPPFINWSPLLYLPLWRGCSWIALTGIVHCALSDGTTCRTSLNLAINKTCSLVAGCVQLASLASLCPSGLLWTLPSCCFSETFHFWA